MKSNTKNYSDRSERSRVNTELDQAQINSVNLIQPPLLPLVPVSPRKLFNLALGAIMGLVLGMFYAFVGDQLGGTVNNVDEMQRIFGGYAYIFLPELNVSTVIKIRPQK